MRGIAAARRIGWGDGRLAMDGDFIQKEGDDAGRRLAGGGETGGNLGPFGRVVGIGTVDMVAGAAQHDPERAE